MDRKVVNQKMPLTSEQMQAIAQEIITNSSNQARATELLGQISTEFEEISTARQTAETNLQAAQVKLLFRQGTSVVTTLPGQQDKTPPDQEKPITYDDLVDEKGNLKF
jgi:CHASE3 domain sensor protein